MNSYAALMGSVQIQRYRHIDPWRRCLWWIGGIGHGDSPRSSRAWADGEAMAASTRIMQEPSSRQACSSNHLIFDGAYNETATDGFRTWHGQPRRILLWRTDLAGREVQVSYKNIGNFEKTGQA